MEGIRRIAVFDFDGTSLQGSSPVLLVRELVLHGMLRKRALLRIMLWGIAYKFRLPQNERRVRGLVFTAFDGMMKDEVDSFFRVFYDEKLDPLFRPRAVEAMERHAREGCEVVVVSASFDPIIKRAMELRPFKHRIATRMQVGEDGCYRPFVEGNPIEGEEKLRAVTHFADENYGTGKWELTYAYGDHHSDRALLKAAQHAFAVTPDRPLARTAAREAWEVLDWSYDC